MTGSQDFSPDNGPTCLESRLFDLRYAISILISPYSKKKRNNNNNRTLKYFILTTINIIHIQFHPHRLSLLSLHIRNTLIFIFIIISPLFRVINPRNKSSLFPRSKLILHQTLENNKSIHPPPISKPKLAAFFNLSSWFAKKKEKKNFYFPVVFKPYPTRGEFGENVIVKSEFPAWKTRGGPRLNMDPV